MPKKIEVVITQVMYGRTVSMEGFESVRFDLTARVDEGQNWRDVYEELKTKSLKLEYEAKEGI